MTELLHSLGINWGIMLAQIVNFTILLVVLAKFVYKPVLRLLDERREKIAEAARNQEKIARELTALAAEKEKILAQARTESVGLIETAKKSGEEAKKKIILQAEAEVSRLKGENEKRLAAEKSRLLQEVKREVGGLVIEAIEKGFAEVLDARGQGKMVEQALAALRAESGETRTETGKRS